MKCGVYSLFDTLFPQNPQRPGSNRLFVLKDYLPLNRNESGESEHKLNM